MTKAIHPSIHRSFYLCPSLIEWMWLAPWLVGESRERGGGRGVEGGGFLSRHSSPIRLILEWRSKQRLPRQQLAGDLTKSPSFWLSGWGCEAGLWLCTHGDWWIDNGLRCRLFWSMRRDKCDPKVHTTPQGQMWRRTTAQREHVFTSAWDTHTPFFLRYKWANQHITIPSTCV